MTYKPIIGVICGHQQNPERYFVNTPYVKALIQAGGVPLLIPYMPREDIGSIIARVDGVLIPGGDDIDPYRFGENPHPKTGLIDPICDELDLISTGWALELKLPILAICRGMQVLNVVVGGTLVQDIPSQITDPLKHAQQAPTWYATHSITIQPSSLLAQIIGDRPQQVNSFHHQSVKQVGTELRICATSPDGIIEAIESTTQPFVLGVQWHPEHMVEHYPAAQKLFTHFVQTASENEAGIN